MVVPDDLLLQRVVFEEVEETGPYCLLSKFTSILVAIVTCKELKIEEPIAHISV